MTQITIHGGDFLPGKIESMFDTIALPVKRGLLWDKTEVFKFSDFQSVEVATEENVKRLGGTVGWGVAGALVAGPLGLLAGAILGGRAKEVTFVATLQDGRSFVATAPPKFFARMKAACVASST